jgi:hypothetical protein
MAVTTAEDQGMLIVLRVSFVVLLLALCTTSRADEAMETGWLELVKGATDPATGTEIVNVEEHLPLNLQKLTLAIPKSAVADPDMMEEVLVVGKMPQKSAPLKFDYTWVQDYDSDSYGLVIHLPRGTEWPIRLYLSSDAGFTK